MLDSAVNRLTDQVDSAWVNEWKGHDEAQLTFQGVWRHVDILVSVSSIGEIVCIGMIDVKADYRVIGELRKLAEMVCKKAPNCFSYLDQDAGVLTLETSTDLIGSVEAQIGQIKALAEELAVVCDQIYPGTVAISWNRRTAKEVAWYAIEPCLGTA